MGVTAFQASWYPCVCENSKDNYLCVGSVLQRTVIGDLTLLLPASHLWCTTLLASPCFSKAMGYPQAPVQSTDSIYSTEVWVSYCHWRQLLTDGECPHFPLSRWIILEDIAHAMWRNQSPPSLVMAVTLVKTLRRAFSLPYLHILWLLLLWVASQICHLPRRLCLSFC